MTDTNVDRCTCAASACPMLATHSRGTNGESQWLCFIHVKAEPDDWFHISAELNRLKWLVGIVRTLRAHGKTTAEHRQACVQAQRSDLWIKDTETPAQWMVRLEGVLAQSCKDTVAQP